jgi:hypothetical protein
LFFNNRYSELKSLFNCKYCLKCTKIAKFLINHRIQSIHTYVRTYIHTYIRTYIHIFIHTYVHTYIYSYIHTYVHTYIHTYIRTYIHIFIHIYIRIQNTLTYPKHSIHHLGIIVIVSPPFHRGSLTLSPGHLRQVLKKLSWALSPT